MCNGSTLLGQVHWCYRHV